jgi:DeoR family transcriptional regulator, glycerol-3-phosphate regulon repressor
LNVLYGQLILWFNVGNIPICVVYRGIMDMNQSQIHQTVTKNNKTTKRHEVLMGLVRQHGTLSVADTARHLGVSEETIRRDSKPLVERGELVKMHGALAMPFHVGEAPLEKRMRENMEAKRSISQAAIQLVSDGDSLIVDAGTTTSVFAQELRVKRRLTVVTNSSDIARSLATVNGNTVYMAGGELMGDSGAAFGPSAIEFVSRFKVKHTFISIGAVDRKLGPMDAVLAEAQFAGRALACADNRVLLTDASKFGRTALVKVCDFADLTHIVTDYMPDPEMMAAIARANVSLTIAKNAA